MLKSRNKKLGVAVGEWRGVMSLQHLLQVQETLNPPSVSYFTKPRNAVECVTKGNMIRVKNWVCGICFLAKRTPIQLLLELGGKYILLPSLELLLLLKTC